MTTDSAQPTPPATPTPDDRQERVTIRVASFLADFHTLCEGRKDSLPTSEEREEEALSVQIAVRSLGRAFALEHAKGRSPNVRRWIEDRVAALAKGMK